ncbi:hypothetical protein THIX_10024 [Thiomonas sp. X19]|nr:hypothetical protein THIX_10024 [Thiomonas sp. X19]
MHGRVVAKELLVCSKNHLDFQGRFEACVHPRMCARTGAPGQGLAPALLKGSGDVTGMVRLVHGLRAKLTVPSTADS